MNNIKDHNLIGKNISYSPGRSIYVLLIIFTILILFQTIFSYYLMKEFNSYQWDSRKHELIKIVDTAYSSFKPVIGRYKKGEISKNRAIQEIRKTVNTMTYRDGEGMNYIFLSNAEDGTLMAHPFEKERIGKNMFDEFPDIKSISQDIKKALNSPAQSSFISYTYKYPGQKHTGKKLTYVRLVPSLGCVIGTGLYIQRSFKRLNLILLIGLIGSFFVLFLIIFAITISLKKIKQTMELLRLSESRFRSIFNGIDHFIALLDSKFNILEINKPAEKITGIQCEEYIGKSFLTSSYWAEHPDSRGVLNTAIEEMKNGNVRRYIAKNYTHSGKEITVDFSIYPIKHGCGHPRQYIVEGKDITEHIEKDAEIFKLAYYDHVTGLPNDQLFEKKVTELLNKGDQEGAMIVVVKLSDIAFINSMMGFDIGTKFLQVFAGRLGDILDEECIVGRLHGGYFVIYMPPVFHIDEKISRMEYLETLCFDDPEPLVFGGHSIKVSIKIGASRYPEHGNNYNELLKNALVAKEAVKHEPSRCVELFDSSFIQKAGRQKIIESILRSSEINASIHAYYQPLIEAQTGSLIGFEALARFSHPDLGDVSPLEFIPIAEQSGTIDRVFSLVLERAADVAAAGKSKKLHVSVNVSVLQLVENRFQERLFDVLRKHELPNSAIPIEITESIFIESFQTLTEILNKLRSEGIMVYIDDFGTGYSSLSCIRNLPADIIKIDKSFVDSIVNDDASRGIIAPIITIVHNLGMKVVAEGVENREQAKILKEIQCNYLQGWFTGRPMSEEGALALISKMS